MWQIKKKKTRMHSSRLIDRMPESASEWVSALGGVSAPRGVSARGDVCSRVGGIPACAEADPLPLPPGNRMTDTSKNITLATTSLRPVIII